jgi:hypothetical protein
MNKREDTYGASLFLFKIVIFLIFGLFILFYKGLQALRRGDTQEAIKWLAVPGVLAGVVLFQMSTSYTQGVAAQRARQADQDREQAALSNPKQTYTFEKLRGGLEAIPDCGHAANPCPDQEGLRFAEYRITDKLSGETLRLEASDIFVGKYRAVPSCMTKWDELNINSENTLHYGESVNLYCIEQFYDVTIIPCVRLLIYPSTELTAACDSNLEPGSIMTKQVEILQSQSVMISTPSLTQMESTATPSPNGLLYQVVHVKSNDVLNIREGAGVKYRITGTIPPDGRGIQITGEGRKADNATWVPILYKDISGWVNRYYLTRQ